MAVTLAQVDAAIAQALASQLKTFYISPGPFAFLGRFVGSLSTADGAFSRMLDRSPAMLLSFDGERDVGDYEQLTGAGEDVGRSTWTVYVISTDPRSIDIAVDGSVGSTGIYDLCERVYGTLSRLLIPAPSATLNVQLTGTPNAVVSLLAPATPPTQAPAATPVLTVGGLGFGATYAPVDINGKALTTVTLDGAGHATIRAVCNAASVQGDLLPNQVLAWAPTTPPGLNLNATCTSMAVASSHGPIRNKRLSYQETRQVPVTGGRVLVMAIRYTIDRVMPDYQIPDVSLPYLGTNMQQHLKDDGTVPASLDPIVISKDS